MRKLVEVVPNFSEGRNKEVIRDIASAIESVEGAVLLDVDPGSATNRTVVTFVAEPEVALQAAFAAAVKAFEKIDMRCHEGAHPRMGAMDVCPFVPVSGVTMEEAVELARRLGEMIGEELGVPVYLYEHAATRERFRNLAEVRSGEYEGLASRDFDDPRWSPDFGPRKFVPESGAVAVGAREFLIAYNVNLNTRDAKIAREIALDIREKGRWARDRHGKVLRDENGNKVRKPGMFKHCKAVGWYIEEYGRAQVTMNLTNYKVTPIHVVYEAVRREAEKHGARVTGSEIVGLVPLNAMLSAGRFYLESQGKSPGLPHRDLVHAAKVSMGLDDVAPFVPEEKIVEWRVAPEDVVARSRLDHLLDSFSRDTAVPGGGSAAALIAALSASLSAMVANLAYGHKGTPEKERNDLGELAAKSQLHKARLLDLAQEDSDAYRGVMEATRKQAKIGSASREQAIQDALNKAASVPMKVLEDCLELTDAAAAGMDKGLEGSMSDSGVAGLAALAAARGAYLNVLINCSEMADKEQAMSLSRKADELLKMVEGKADGLWRSCLRRLSRGADG